MKKLFKSKQSEEILEFLHETVVLLAANKFEEALKPISDSLYTPQILKYTPRKLKEGIGNYFNDGIDRFVTDPQEASDMHPRQRASLEHDDDETVNVVHPKYPFCVCWAKENEQWEPLYARADLPLNGNWGDRLTLKFNFESRPGGFAIVIEDIEVM